MSFDERQIQDVIILNCVGQLAYTAGAELRRRIVELCGSGRANVVLNVEGVTYVDSSGLGGIVDALIKVRRRGGDLRFVNPSARMQQLLKITAIAPLIETYQSEAIAVASFNPIATAKPASES